MPSSVRWTHTDQLPAPVALTLNLTTGERPIKKTNPPQKNLPPLATAEIYGGPPPPRDGRLVSVDCHPDTFTAAVFEGTTAHDARKLSSRENLSLTKLLDWAGKEFTHKDLFVMEAGGNSFEIHRRLVALGLRAVVLESAYVGLHAKKYADNDKMAAARIALVYLGGTCPCVWVPDAQSSERRELLHAHQNVVAAHTAATNELKGYLNQFTIRLGSRSLHLERTHQWICQQRTWTPLQRELLEHYFTQLVAQKKRRDQLRQLIAREVAAAPLMLRCMKLLGIGLINAFALLAIIGDVRRFERPQKLVAYIGLNPGQQLSGLGKNIKLGIGRRGRGDLRHLLIQGAQAVLRAGRHTELGKWGWKLFARKGHRNIAVSAVARKLVVQVWHLLMGNPPTGLETNQSLTLKLHKLAVTLGKDLRLQLQLPATLKDCVVTLRQRILPHAPPTEPV
jgi:transposase